MRRQEHMERQNVDVVIGDKKDFPLRWFRRRCRQHSGQSEFKKIVLLSERIVIVSISSSDVKNSSPHRGRQIRNNGPPANLQRRAKDRSTCEDWQAPGLVSTLNSALATSVLSLGDRVFAMCRRILEALSNVSRTSWSATGYVQRRVIAHQITVKCRHLRPA